MLGGAALAFSVVVVLCLVLLAGSSARPAPGGINEEFRARREDALEAKALLADKLAAKAWVDAYMPDMPHARTLARGVSGVSRWVASNPLAPAVVKLTSACKKNTSPERFTARRARRWMRQRTPYGREWWRRTGLGDFYEPHYALIRPQVFAEERLAINCYNYQFFVVRGRLVIVQRYCEEGVLPVRTFFGADLLPDPDVRGLQLLSDPRPEVSPLPPTAPKMREWAEAAGAMLWEYYGIELVRVDFYHVPYRPDVPEGPGKAYFGEFTFTPAAFHMPLRRCEDRLLGERVREALAAA